MENRIQKLTINTPMTVDDLVAELSLVTGFDDEALFKKIPELKGYKGKITLLKHEIAKMKGAARVVHQMSQGGALRSFDRFFFTLTTEAGGKITYDIIFREYDGLDVTGDVEITSLDHDSLDDLLVN